ncbi:MAG: RluA family pseudouridine synthase [Oscillospiraceae bacterium]
MREMNLTVPKGFEGAAAQDYLRALGFSRRAIIKLKQSGGLTRNGAVLRMVDVIHSGERLSVKLSEDMTTELPQPNPELSAPIVYQDEDVVVFNKPPEMPVHPSIRHYDDTLANLFAAQFPGLPFRPINRLDRNTSGLCVCAKNRFAASSLADSLEKVYFAVTDGTPPGDTIDQPIGRADGSIIKRCVTPEGSRAVTHFSVIGGIRRRLLRVTLETGRTHQIRVHMAFLGFPLCGDEMYGGDCSDIQRHALHCGEVSFTQPVSRETIKLSAPLPNDMAALLTEEQNDQSCDF